MCFFDPDKDHLHIGLSVGGFVSRSKDLLKKLTIIDDKGGSRGGGTFWRSSRAFSIRGPPQSKILEPPMGGGWLDIAILMKIKSSAFDFDFV